MWKALGISIGLVLCGCASTPRPDFQQLYSFAGAAADERQPPVIVIPGILGSRLRDKASGREIWPGPLWDLLFTGKEELALRFDPQTLLAPPEQAEAYALFEQAFGAEFYGPILKTLEQYGGYRRTTAGTPVTGHGRRYYVFPYDWRQDNVRTAQQLDRLIEQVRRDWGDPKLRVDIVAHSMGGLITRYFLRYGATDVLGSNDLKINFAGCAKVRLAVLLGTPNLGSASSLHGFLAGERVGLKRVPPEVLATMPSTYQLFPHPLNTWLVDAKGAELDRDLFDVQTWRRFGWSVFAPEIAGRLRAARGEAYVAGLQRYFGAQLERARRFVWALTRELKDSPERLVVFGGDCTMTPARLLVEERDGDSVVRLFPDEIEAPVRGIDYRRLMLEPGDGSVTKPSLLARENLNPAAPRHRYAFFPLAYSFFLCEAHQNLTNNLSFQDNLLNVLLTQERPFDQKPSAVAPPRKHP